MKNIDIQTDNIRFKFKKVRDAKGLTQTDFYGPITNHVSNCCSMENGKRGIGPRLSRDIINYHHINLDWINTGEGEMFDEEPSSQNLAIAETEQGVPFFNVNLSEMSFGSVGLFREPPEYYVNFRPFNDCDAYLPIYGDSMYPKYASGETIAVREIRNFSILQWGEAYLIVADERANGITTVKLLFEHADQEKIVLRSSNPNFKGDTVIDRTVIQRMFIVKGKITRNQL